MTVNINTLFRMHLTLESLSLKAEKVIINKENLYSTFICGATI